MKATQFAIMDHGKKENHVTIMNQEKEGKPYVYIESIKQSNPLMVNVSL
jgi:hypothetical protein